jgi:hypothetical protein
MFTFIAKMRNKPEGEKRKFAIIVSLSITAVIALLWLVSLIMRINAGGFTWGVSDAGSSRIEKSVAGIGESWDAFMKGLGNLKGEEAVTTTTQEEGTSSI